MEIVKIRITPKETAQESTCELTIVGEDGETAEIPAVSGLIISALTDLDFYTGVQGNPIHIHNFLAHELTDIDSFLCQFFLGALATAINVADEKELTKIYTNMSIIMDMIGDKQEELIHKATEGEGA